MSRQSVGNLQLTHDLVVWKQPPEIGLGADIYYAALDGHMKMYVGSTPREAVENLVRRLEGSTGHIKIDWNKVDSVK